MVQSIKKKTTKRNITICDVHVRITLNNTLITFAEGGEVISGYTAGRGGFKGSKKATPHAGQITAGNVAEIAKARGIKAIRSLFISGIGYQRDSVVRALNNQGISVTNIVDRTPIPHNGTRPKKARRV